MGEQELITDLAIAERNVNEKIKYCDVHFGNEIRNAFTKYNVNTYIDLVRADLKNALKLRDLAIKENLLYYHIEQPNEDILFIDDDSDDNNSSDVNEFKNLNDYHDLTEYKEYKNYSQYCEDSL